MKNILFLMSHLGGSNLFDTLCTSSIIDGFRTEASYNHPSDLHLLTDNIHKNDNLASIYLDELVYNHSLTCRSICDACKFIYFIPDHWVLNHLVASYGYSPTTALRYYSSRLQGLYDYMQRTPECVVVIGEVDKDVRFELADWLELPEELGYNFVDISETKDIGHKAYEGLREFGNVVPNEIIAEAQQEFDKYVYSIRKLGLRVL